MEGEEDGDTVLYPVAMFVGEMIEKPSCGSTVYQAVMLDPNISVIKEYYFKEVTNLRLPPPQKEEDLNSGADSGFQSHQ